MFKKQWYLFLLVIVVVLQVLQLERALLAFLPLQDGFAGSFVDACYLQL